MITGNSKSLKLLKFPIDPHIDGVILDIVETFKYLGLTTNSSLTPKKLLKPFDLYLQSSTHKCT